MLSSTHFVRWLIKQFSVVGTGLAGRESEALNHVFDFNLILIFVISPGMQKKGNTFGRYVCERA